MRKCFLILLCATAAGSAGRVDFTGPLVKPSEWVEAIGPTLKSHEWVEPPGLLESPSLQEKEPLRQFLESYTLLGPPLHFAALEAPRIEASAVPEPSGWVLIVLGTALLGLAAVPRRILARCKLKIRYDG